MLKFRPIWPEFEFPKKSLNQASFDIYEIACVSENSDALVRNRNLSGVLVGLNFSKLSCRDLLRFRELCCSRPFKTRFREGLKNGNEIRLVLGLDSGGTYGTQHSRFL